ncbi:MAG: PEP-CTERM sorting domain-containing protein [Armatimonadetes bacterium]|nr:PEP-CTERM sorting domain-containing protein [Armatimonadota bacterium]
MKILACVAAAFVAQFGFGAILFDQMTNPTSTIIPSSWVTPDGSDSDTYSWDNFLLPYDSTINEVWWVGGGGPITGFTVRFYTGLASAPDLQPTISALPESETSADYLKGYRFQNKANETQIAGTSLYQYHVNLPTPLALQANKVYWIKIEADTTSFPSWGLAQASHGRDTGHFRYITGLHMFQRVPGSEAFQLIGTVPEPASLSAIALGLVAVMRRRSR